MSIENRLERINSRSSEGFFIETIIKDIDSLQKGGDRFLTKEEIPEYYLRLSDFLVQKKATYSDLLQTVIHLRKEEYSILTPIQIENLLAHVRLLNHKNLNETQENFYP